MDFISEEFIAARTGDPLEKRLRESERFRQQMKTLHEVSEAFSRDSGISKKAWDLYGTVEEEWTNYNILYGEESYRLGYEDGAQVASERKIREKGSVLSVKDMTHLIYVYDAVKKLNIFLLGEWDNYDRDRGMLRELDRVCHVIADGACSEIRLRDEDEAYEKLLGRNGKNWKKIFRVTVWRANLHHTFLIRLQRVLEIKQF